MCIRVYVGIHMHFRSKPYMDCVKTALQEFQPPLAMWHSNTMSVYLAGSAMSKHVLTMLQLLR
jgi:hypothetical protein